MIITNTILKLWIPFLLIHVSGSLISQKVTIVATNIDGIKDTVQFGFTENATIGEDPALGEFNLFGTPVNDFEMRILQRDEENHECSMLEVNGTKIYYNENFDSKVNLRAVEDTSLANRMFEVWFSDYSTDSLKIMSEVNIKGFLNAYQYLYVCDDTLHHSPVGTLVVEDDVYTLEYKVAPGFWPKDFVFVILPQDVTTSIEDAQDVSHEIKIHPNPVTDHFVLQSELRQVEKIVVRNFNGQIVARVDNPVPGQELNLEPYPSGMYMVQIWLDDGRTIIEKILKQ